ncbi:hypothetical protein B0T22DRAFT_162549 [Podospora appendiculata]|uniref:Tat pathway signal sequence n=1 Tax=Podospora appendiculata TaxID=314037 RepID=A0AAE0XAP1_9PEZI|nr:hypothetical protein B0T22DRAFT_162549 [Podospora appendiculata]
MAPSHSYEPLNPAEKENDDSSDFVEEEAGHAVPLAFHRDKSRWRYHLAAIALLLLSNVVFAGLWFKTWMSHQAHQEPSNCARTRLTYSPADSVIRYEKKRLWRDIEGPNPFIGQPRPELDQAWREIIAPITIKVSGDELARFSEGDSSIAFKDGSGYLAEMGVYHELHCIKRVRRYLHLEHYYPNMTDADRVIEDLHIEHCLEYWRQSVMCRGDTTLGTFFWRADGMATSHVYTDNECVDWHALDTWARKRMVDTADYSQFVKDDK